MIRAIQGDITKVTGFQAIVNSANNSLLGGGGIDGIIHRAAGPQLRTECRTLNGCETGDSKLTFGYNLPCEYIIHSVGPVWMGGQSGENALLTSCYKSAMKIAKENNIRSIAFSSISTGEYGFPMDKAAKIAIDTVSAFIEKYPDSFDDICWVLADDIGFNAYSKEIANYVPKKTEPKKRNGKKSKAAETTAEDENTSAAQSETPAVDKNESAEQAETTDGTDATADSTNTVDDATSEGPSMESSTTKESSDTSDETSTTTDGATQATAAKSTIRAPWHEQDNDADKAAASAEFTLPTPIWNKYSTEWLSAEITSGKALSYTCFELNSVNDDRIFSPTDATTPFCYNGRSYTSVEQYMIMQQALLFNDIEGYASMIATGILRNNAIRNFDKDEWIKVCPEIIFRAYAAKYISDKTFATALNATGDSVILAAGNDDILTTGAGADALPGTQKVTATETTDAQEAPVTTITGLNILGFALMAVRDYYALFCK